MNQTRLFSLLAACCLAVVCSTSLFPSQVDADETQDLRAKLAGAWGLVGPPGADGEPQEGRWKFWGLHHWCTTQVDPDSGEVIYHHGGTYTLEGDVYTETVRFAAGASANQVGKSYKFKIKVEGDTFVQTGVDNPYNEKWVRLKKKKDE